MPFVPYSDKTPSDVEYEKVNFDELTSCYTYNPLFTAITSHSKTEKDENNYFQLVNSNEEIHFKKSGNRGFLDLIWIYDETFSVNDGTIIVPDNEKINVITKMNLKNYRYIVDSIHTTDTKNDYAHSDYTIRDGQTYTKLGPDEKIIGCNSHFENILNNKYFTNIFPVIRYIDTNGKKMLFIPHALSRLSIINNSQSSGVLTSTGGVAQNTDNIIYLMLNDINKSITTVVTPQQYVALDDDPDIKYMWWYKNESSSQLYMSYSYSKLLEILALLGVYFRIGGKDYLGYMDKTGQTTGEYLLENEWNKSAQYNSDTINNFTKHEPLPDPGIDDIESVGYGYFSNTVMGTLYALHHKLDLEKISNWFFTQTEKIDIAKNVISLKEIPFSLSTLNIIPLNTDLKIGGVNVTYNNENVSVGQIVGPGLLATSVLFGEFDIPRLSNTFLDYSPYTKYEILLPFAPSPVSLPDWCVDKTVKAIFLYDIYTTSCQYIIECDGERICSVSGTFGVDRPLSSQNVALKDASRLSSQVATASSVLGGVMSASVGNIGGIMSGAISGVSAISQMLLSQKQNYMYAIGANGDTSSIGLCHAAHLKITRTLSAETDGYLHTYGKPLCKMKKLSEMTGFTKCENVSTDGLTCSETEKRMIKQLLENGIYI